ncbi:MAG: tRNA (adenosine(37)-N6)-dimethylallyltransferase MiaA [Candidatus Omnitrophica bacterium]|nr:tRNA (adenosine(37)-N6)-dimethylallyltransferase MiaA [Candidatus Omnitrophota bacterium]
MILAIVGPTGIGKSEVAMALARSVPSEIVVVDSMQVYRGMDRGTGKPDSAQQKEIPHHGIDLVEPEEEFDVARYRNLLAPVIRAIQAKGRLPILVGGSGLYFRAILDGLCEAPGRDPFLREHLLQQGTEQGAAVLHAELEKVDPEAAARIHPNDLRRIVRALEVFRATGRALSQWQGQTTHPLDGDKRLIGLSMDRALLYQQIEERIDGWLNEGWLEEAGSLNRRALSRTAREALGYRELFAFLEGQADWPMTVSLIKRNTRRYAKRQLAWFRADPRIQWLDVDGKGPEALTAHILDRIRWNEPSLSTSA